MKFTDMFSSRGTPAYSVAPNYTYQTGYPATYNDAYGVNTTNQFSNVDGTNGNYQQNLSLPVYAVSNPASRQQVVYEDWVMNSNPCSYQNQSISYNAYHLPRNTMNIGTPNVPFQGAAAADGHGLVTSRTDGQLSPESAVALSSDGLSGTESPELFQHHNINNNNAAAAARIQQARSPFEWMKRQSYQSQPNPGKTRTKDKYRVVYTDHQRLELEKEFHFSKYITIRRKAEIALSLGLSERQVKIWFQNRRAKDRKLAKKREEIEQKNKEALLHQQNAISISSINYLRSHFDPENNRSIAIFSNGDHLRK